MKIPLLLIINLSPINRDIYSCMGCCASNGKENAVHSLEPGYWSDGKSDGSVDYFVIDGQDMDTDIECKEIVWDVGAIIRKANINPKDVKKLSFNKCNFDYCVDLLGDFINLEELILMECYWEFEGVVEVIASISTLKRLDLSGCNVTDAHIDELATIRSSHGLGLEGLNVSNTFVTGLHMDRINGLKRLTMRGCKNVSCDLIAKLVQLEDLDLSGSLATNVRISVNFIDGLVNLRNLNLSNNNFLLGFARLRKNADGRILNLVKLDLGNCVLWENEFELLRESNTQCDFSGCRLA